MEEAQPSYTMKENWAGLLKWKVAGWIVEDGFWKGVRVAPWVVKQQKQTLYCSLVGFHKSKTNGLMRSELWIESCWGRKPVNIKMLDDNIVWMQFHMEKEVEEVLDRAAKKGIPSPFTMLERWMEVQGPPATTVWVRIKGVPLQVWHEEVFKLLGYCLGRTVEVDSGTVHKDSLREGRVKVLLDTTGTMTDRLKIWVEELLFTVGVELEEERMEREDTGENGEGSQQREIHQSGCSCRMQAESRRRRKVDDDDVMPFHSNFDLPAQVEEERGLVGRGKIWTTRPGPFALLGQDAVYKNGLRESESLQFLGLAVVLKMG
eukprot:TRINITY_DN10711_c0_g2_i1.p1 TRINITY_DN10711_c0_g2~~TRINITY_DN10711_c0_g2_i1.p1  ORF type:complete len:318 (-),score=66.73 TRINITY_DN10711_c0_g2_i1:542-1495(-)